MLLFLLPRTKPPLFLWVADSEAGIYGKIINFHTNFAIILKMWNDFDKVKVVGASLRRLRGLTCSIFIGSLPLISSMHAASPPWLQYYSILQSSRGSWLHACASWLKFKRFVATCMRWFWFGLAMPILACARDSPISLVTCMHLAYFFDLVL